MRILRSIRSVDPVIGGPVESVKQSSAMLQKRGHVVEIVSLDAPNDSWVQNFPTTVHALGPGRGTYGFAPAFAPWLRQHAADYDAVIIHGVWQYNSFGVWRALCGAVTPYYVFPHGMLDPWFKRTYPLKHLKKLAYWPWAEYRVLRDAAAVLFTSDEERRLARESFGLYRCNERVVNYGTAAPDVDPTVAREEFFERYPALRGKRICLFLSRLHEKKGCDLLLDAFAEVCRSQSDGEPPIHLVMAGPPADEAYLRQLQERVTDSARVTFCGMLSGNLKWGAFAAADVFVLPSHQENFGISVVEALASGVPVLISDCVNIWREIAADHAGFIEKDDLAGTTRLLERWLATMPEEREAMRKNAKDCFASRFEIARATESLLAVLQSPDAREATS
jgi:glycosyltransferase involved in cell wall biosynthesis